MAQFRGRSGPARTTRRRHRICASRGLAAARRQRLRTQQLQDWPCAVRHRADARPGRAEDAAVDLRQENTVSAMASYVGTATSRVDGRAKVTGEAKYAGEFTVPDLVHGSLVVSAIPRGRIQSIDARAALRVKGVLEVLTHHNRPALAASDEAWKDEVAPEQGSPFRPLYDDAIKFSEQPVALVLAED